MTKADQLLWASVRNHHDQLEELTPEQAEELKAAGVVPPKEEAPSPAMMRIDLHCHSEASPDCSTPLELIPPRCQDRQINIQAITDHNRIWGAQKLKEIVAKKSRLFPGLQVIIGEEISTTEGEIVGLFLEKPVEAGLTPEETIALIKEQSGLVLVPHGFDPLKRFRLQPEALERIASQVDIIETFNTRVSRPRWNRAAVAWARQHGVLMSAGSDAHTLADIGSAWVEVPRCRLKEPDDLLQALKDGVPVGEWTFPVVAFLYKTWDRMLRRFGVNPA